MITEKIVEAIKKEVEKEMSCSAHDMSHIIRVYNLANYIAESEKNVNLKILKAAVLLHDIGRVKEDNDPTGITDHSIIGAKMAGPILERLKFSKEEIKKIQDCIISHRYKTGNVPKTIEAKILFDADKIDLVGAIGVARAFVWVGKNNARIYRKLDIKKYAKENLERKNIKGRIKDKTKHSPQIEYETKVKHVGDKLYTRKAREIFKKRIGYFENFLNQLEKEYEGEI